MAYPAVLIHGMCCTGANWKRVISLMTPNGYECLAPSLPEHDASPDQRLQVSRQSLRDYLAFLEMVLATREERRPPIIIGHSMGGLLAQQLAVRVQPLALVLLTPAAPYGIYALSQTNTGALLSWLSSGAFWRNAYKPSLALAQRYAFCGLPANQSRSLYEGMVYESGRAIFEICLWPFDFSRASTVDAQRIHCPVYIVNSGKDRLTPASVVRNLARLYPQATQRHNPTRGHFVIDDEGTDEMVHSICSWLRPIVQKQERSGRG
jgi:pimeloyl-ACP methyl ester carboxylesterase